MSLISERLSALAEMSSGTGMAFRLGLCTFDPETRELFRGGRSIALSPKAFRLLEALIERRPKAVSKDELHTVLWPQTYVSEGSLARLVNEARQAIGDSAEEPRFLRTIHGFGYAFSGAIATEPRPPGAWVQSEFVFKLIWGDREIALAEGENVLGRAPDSVLCIDVHSVSRHHARIMVSGEQATLEDLGSKNGTYVADRKLTSPTPLADGDRIRIGTAPMTFRRFSRGGTTETSRSG